MIIDGKILQGSNRATAADSTVSQPVQPLPLPPAGKLNSGLPSCRPSAAYLQNNQKALTCGSDTVSSPLLPRHVRRRVQHQTFVLLTCNACFMVACAAGCYSNTHMQLSRSACVLASTAVCADTRLGVHVSQSAIHAFALQYVVQMGHPGRGSNLSSRMSNQQTCRA